MNKRVQPASTQTLRPCLMSKCGGEETIQSMPSAAERTLNKFGGAVCLIAVALLQLLNPINSTLAAKEPQSLVLPQQEKLLTIASDAEKSSRPVIPGTGGWLYFAPELRAVSIGRFWGAEASKVSRATKPEYADPFEAILDFHSQLKRIGADLLLVPVPAKVSIYPELLLTDLDHTTNGPPIRLDTHHEQFYKLLQEQGVAVLDLVPSFLKERRAGQSELYCKTDSHWSGQGILIAAKQIVSRIEQAPFLQQVSKESFHSIPRRITIEGDLAKLLNNSQPLSETLAVAVCGRQQGDQVIPLEPDRSSPVLLIGDSHTLVFHDPMLFARGAGLPDHLARELGFAIDLIGVRGSGATTTRIELFRRKDNLEGKKLVIWCLSIREFTESETGWRKIPVIRP
jgi:hypothetical protein